MNTMTIENFKEIAIANIEAAFIKKGYSGKAECEFQTYKNMSFIMKLNNKTFRILFTFNEIYDIMKKFPSEMIINIMDVDNTKCNIDTAADIKDIEVLDSILPQMWGIFNL